MGGRGRRSANEGVGVIVISTKTTAGRRVSRAGLRGRGLGCMPLSLFSMFVDNLLKPVCDYHRHGDIGARASSTVDNPKEGSPCDWRERRGEDSSFETEGFGTAQVRRLSTDRPRILRKHRSSLVH